MLISDFYGCHTNISIVSQFQSLLYFFSHRLTLAIVLWSCRIFPQSLYNADFTFAKKELDLGKSHSFLLWTSGLYGLLLDFEEFGRFMLGFRDILNSLLWGFLAALWLLKWTLVAAKLFSESLFVRE